MALIADGLPDKSGDLLALELRAIHADMPLLIAGPAGTDGEHRRFEGQRGIAFFRQPYDEEALRQALSELGVRSETREIDVS